MARGGRGAGQEQKARPRRAECAARRREEAEADLHRRAREAQPRSVLRGAATALRREDSRHRGEARPQEERSAGVVLQPAAETEAHEVRGAALTGGRRRGSAVPRRRVRLLSPGRRPAAVPPPSTNFREQ